MNYTAFVIANDGTRLMPTHVAKARKLLHMGKAIIVKYEPFTIRLTYETSKNVQPVEITVDTGYLHIGLDVKSEKHEFISDRYDLLPNEVEHHKDCYKYRHARRNRLRYREKRFDNRKKPKGWLPPSLQHKIEAHVQKIKAFFDVCPVTSIHLECGQFDTQVLKAIQEGKPVPHGKEYQRGEQYAYDTVREAVFSRDNYTCQVCKKTPWKDNISLRRHHIGFWKNDRSDRMSNQLTVCNLCHTPKNHTPDGVLYGLDPKVSNMASAAFMNSVKYEIYRQVSEFCENAHITYGTVTKHVRKERNLEKSHTNDAYCIGDFHPKHRCQPRQFEKRRRNNRVLSKFYDAKYIDSRDGSKRSGAQLSCGRTKRNHNTDSENLHRYRQQKISKGRFAVRKKHYKIQPGDIVIYQGKKYVCNGCHCNGTRVILMPEKKSVAIKNITVVRYAGGWKPVLN